MGLTCRKTQRGVHVGGIIPQDVPPVPRLLVQVASPGKLQTLLTPCHVFLFCLFETHAAVCTKQIKRLSVASW